MNNLEKAQHACGTYFLMRRPWFLLVGGAALCPDGKVRKLKRISVCADTFFSVPAAVSYRGKTVAGYCTLDDGVIEFRPYEYRKNGSAFSGAVIDDNFMVCSDCYPIIANSDYTGLDYHYDEKQAGKRAREIDDCIAAVKGHIVAGDSAKYEEFSNSTCDCCGDYLAGSRYHCMVLVK